MIHTHRYIYIYDTHTNIYIWNKGQRMNPIQSGCRRVLCTEIHIIAHMYSLKCYIWFVYNFKKTSLECTCLIITSKVFQQKCLKLNTEDLTIIISNADKQVIFKQNHQMVNNMPNYAGLRLKWLFDTFNEKH